VSRVPVLSLGPGPIICTLRIAAGAHAIFDLLADPRRHPELDGSGTLRGVVVGPDRLQAGSRFGMAMRYWGVPYTITNTVVEYEQDRLIAWTHLSRVIWRYRLEPVPGGTRVTETWDPTGSPIRAGYGLLRFPERTAPAMLATLERLKAAVEA